MDRGEKERMKEEIWTKRREEQRKKEASKGGNMRIKREGETYGDEERDTEKEEGRTYGHEVRGRMKETRTSNKAGTTRAFATMQQDIRTPKRENGEKREEENEDVNIKRRKGRTWMTMVRRRKWMMFTTFLLSCPLGDRLFSALMMMIMILIMMMMMMRRTMMSARGSG